MQTVKRRLKTNAQQQTINKLNYEQTVKRQFENKCKTRTVKNLNNKQTAKCKL